MTAEAIKFDQDRSGNYDLDISKAIPGYEALHNMAQSLLQTNVSSSAKLLIVGSGTGMELINFCQNDRWSLIGVDPSEDMMTIAKQKLTIAKLLERVYLHTGYVDTLPKTELMDAATLILVMHFVRDDGSKLKLLKSIAQRLKPEGKIILVDLYGDKSASYFAEFKKAWQNLYFSQLEGNAKAEAIAKFETSIDNSIHFVNEDRIVELLNMAGFSQIKKFYNAFLFGGWIAKLTGE